MISSTNPVVANALGINFSTRDRKISDVPQWREAKQKWDAAYRPLLEYRRYLWRQEEYRVAEPLGKAIDVIYDAINVFGKQTISEIV